MDIQKTCNIYIYIIDLQHGLAEVKRNQLVDISEQRIAIM